MHPEQLQALAFARHHGRLRVAEHRRALHDAAARSTYGTLVVAARRALGFRLVEAGLRLAVTARDEHKSLARQPRRGAAKRSRTRLAGR